LREWDETICSDRKDVFNCNYMYVRNDVKLHGRGVHDA
jgi:hypothetical protein